MKKSNQAFRIGSYSLAASALVLAVLVVVNILAGVLPASLTTYDISASQLYSVTSNTKTVLNHLEEDVTIYWITQAGEENEILKNLLDHYESLSDHINVVKKNPDVFPTFAEQYTKEPVENNSLVVESGERNRFIPYSDIYVKQTDLSNMSYKASFDGEGAITSAIDFVVNAEQPIIYTLEGHGEQPLPEAFQDQVQKSNMELKPLSLLNVEAIPEDADCIFIHAPGSDLSPEEQKILQDYTKTGGKLLVLAGPTESGTLHNLYGLLQEYGVDPAEGLAVEADRSHFAFEPCVLMPEISSHPTTDPLLEEHYSPVVPLAQGLHISDTAHAVTSLLTTSDTSFSKPAGFALTTYQREEGDVDGPFSVAVDIDCGNGGEIFWVSSSEFLNELYNAYSSGANVDLTMNALASMIGKSEALAIRSRSLNYNYLTISESSASLLKILLIGVFPLTYLGIGIAVVVRRKEKNHG